MSLPPVFLVPKTYDLWQSDVTATFWHGLWQLGRNNNNNTRLSCHRTAFLWYRPPPPSPTSCHVLTSRPVVSSFRQRFPSQSSGLRPKGLCSHSLFLCLSRSLQKCLYSRSFALSRPLPSLSNTHPISLALPFHSLVFVPSTTNGFYVRERFGFFLVYIFLLLLLFLSTNNERCLSNFYWLLPA